MPELPDLAVLADAFGATLTGRRVSSIQVVQSLVMRGTPAEAEALVGQQLQAISRRGKFLTFSFSRDTVVVNPMLTGRLGIALPGSKPLAQTALVVSFDPAGKGSAPPGKGSAPPGKGSAPPGKGSAPPGPEWTRNAPWLPPRDGALELRYRDPTRMGKVYLVPVGTARTIAGWDEQGPDADAPDLDLETWRARIGRHSGELKNVLRNQAFVAGIGNGYSDEILWVAMLAPFRKRSTLAPEEVDRLYAATREVLPWATETLRQRVPPRFEVEVRDFLRVHRKGGQPCPRCGTTISQVAPGGFVTSFCRSCQR